MELKIFQDNLYSFIVIIGDGLIFIGSYLISRKFFKESKTISQFDWNSVANLFISVSCTIGFMTLVDTFEENQLKSHGITTSGVIFKKARLKRSNYNLVKFQTRKNEQFESKNYNMNLKFGDTVKVIYAERIPAINRAD